MRRSDAGFPGAGFTLVELVVTIGLAGLIAAVAVPRFVGRSTFESRGFHDVAIASVRFAQKTAIAWRRDIHVCVAANTLLVATQPGCADGQVVNPSTSQSVGAVPPAGVTLAGPSFSFDGLGRPSAGPVTIAVNTTIPGDVARQIVIEAETGYVRP